MGATACALRRSACAAAESEPEPVADGPLGSPPPQAPKVAATDTINAARREGTGERLSKGAGTGTGARTGKPVELNPVDILFPPCPRADGARAGASLWERGALVRAFSDLQTLLTLHYKKPAFRAPPLLEQAAAGRARGGTTQ
jgi:hypothetical protein